MPVLLTYPGVQVAELVRRAGPGDRPVGRMGQPGAEAGLVSPDDVVIATRWELAKPGRGAASVRQVRS